MRWERGPGVRVEDTQRRIAVEELRIHRESERHRDETGRLDKRHES